MLVLFTGASYAVQAPNIRIQPTILVTASPQSVGVNLPANIAVKPYLVGHWETTSGTIYSEMNVDLQCSGPGTATLGKTSDILADGFKDQFSTTFKAPKAGDYTVTVTVTYSEFYVDLQGYHSVSKTVTNSTKVTVTSGNIGFNPGGLSPGLSGIASPSPSPTPSSSIGNIGIGIKPATNISGLAGSLGNGTPNQTAQPSNDSSGQATQPGPSSSTSSPGENTQDARQSPPGASPGVSAVASIPSPTASTVPSATPQQSGSGDNGSTTTYLLIAVVALLAIVGIMGGYLLGKGKK